MEQSKFYKPELDVVRFAAFFSVFLFHILPEAVKKAPPLPWSLSPLLLATVQSFRFGLSLFFFLSAYLIATLLEIEREKYGRIDLKAFYIRRILRIWPLYFTGVMVGVLFCLWRYRDQLPMFKYFAFFGANFYFSHRPFTGGLMEHLWSISVEEQFYLVFPLLMAFWGKAPRCLIGGLFLAVSLAALNSQGARYPVGDTAIWTNTLCQFAFFGAGIACALYPGINGIRPGGPVRLFLGATACASFLGASFFFFRSKDASAEMAMGGYFLALIGCLLLLFSVLNIGPIFPRPIIFLGKISYGLYVWHRLGIFLVGHFIGHNPLIELTSIFPTIGIAVLSYFYLEMPFLRWKSRFTKIRSRPV